MQQSLHTVGQARLVHPDIVASGNRDDAHQEGQQGAVPGGHGGAVEADLFDARVTVKPAFQPGGFRQGVT
jgi:hypothetical protein